MIPDETIDSLEQLLAEKEKYKADEAGIRPSTDRKVSAEVPLPKSVVYIDYDDPFVLADHASGDPHVNALSRNAWVCCGESVYVLECLGKGYIRIEPVEDDDPNRRTL